MTAAVGPVAGTKLYIGDTSTTPSPDDADYVEIGDISNLGDLSLDFAEVKIESIGSGYSYSLKGTQEAPNIQLLLNRNDSDLGQIALNAASQAARGTLYNFKIVETDGGHAYWKGEVFGYGTSYGGVNDVRKVKTSVSVRPQYLIIQTG
jgi:hypothetical protein